MQKHIYFILVLTFTGLLFTIKTKSVSAHHYTWSSENPSNQINFWSGADPFLPENIVFSEWYQKSVFGQDYSGRFMKIYNELSNDGQYAINVWFNLIGGGTHLDYQSVSYSNRNSAHLTLKYSVGNCPVGASGCWVHNQFTIDQSRGSNQWYKSTVYLVSLPYKTTADKRAIIMHEMGHAFGLYEQFKDTSPVDCNNPSSSVHSIMEGAQYNASGQVEMCDQSALIPQLQDNLNVKKYFGYSDDSNQTYPYVSINRWPGTGVTYKFNDKAWGTGV